MFLERSSCSNRFREEDLVGGWKFGGIGAWGVIGLMVVKSLEAQYENGVLRPSEKLALRPGERVNIIVIRRPDQGRWDLPRLARRNEEESALTEQGLADWARALDAEDQS